jgi:hypothetical protein
MGKGGCGACKQNRTCVAAQEVTLKFQLLSRCPSQQSPYGPGSLPAFCVVCLLQLSERSTTPEGFDTSFATNVLGTTALTQRLLPALVAGAPSRVVFVSSGGMYTQPLCLKDLQHAKLQPWDGSAAYGQEKRCQVALADHLAQAWAEPGGGREGGGTTPESGAAATGTETVPPGAPRARTPVPRP